MYSSNRVLIQLDPTDIILSHSLQIVFSLIKHLFSITGILVSPPFTHGVSSISSMADSDNESGGGHNGDHSLREQDRFLPIANVSRIMKKALPANAKISKDAKETVQECVSEFISFITGEASDKCQREKRKTINGDDLLWAMTTLGFEDYGEPLKVYLQRFRDMEGEKTALAGAGRPSGTNEGSVVNVGNKGVGFHEHANNNSNEGNAGNVYGNMVGQGGYGSGPGGYYQMGQNSNGNIGSVYPGPASLNGKPG